MRLPAHRWKQFAESRYAHEREALEFLRDGLPDSDPIFLYSNFEFIADDGSANEIDALVVSRAGVFLVTLGRQEGSIQIVNFRMAQVYWPMLIVERRSTNAAHLF